MAPQVRKSRPEDKNPSISQAKAIAQDSSKELLNFSFKYFQDSVEKFPCVHDDSMYYPEVMRRLKALCTLKTQEIFSNRSSALRAHPITWRETSEKSFGIPAEDEIVDTPYQLSIGANEHGRLHGFFIYNTFYVVWLDKNHALYPKRK